jgi:regulator of sirC expression with transglutaminase-like and TPR domain
MIGKPGDPAAQAPLTSRGKSPVRPGAPSDPLLTPRARAARRRLAVLLGQPGPLPLLEATLEIAAEEHESMDVLAQIARVETIGEAAKERLAGLTNLFAKLDALRVFLFEELGFKGNVDNYDDPRNSYLDDVLERKLGIPLTLSILVIEVARRAGLDASGVGLPGHFIVRIEESGRSLLIDPFHGGHIITIEDCKDLVVRTTGRASLFRKDSVDTATPRAMLTRLLLNLKRIHLAQGDYIRALAVVERLLVIAPSDAKEIRDRGLLLAHLGQSGAAVSDLECYLALAPGAPDVESVRGRLAWIRRRAGAAT